jgi:hypothetical protein
VASASESPQLDRRAKQVLKTLGYSANLIKPKYQFADYEGDEVQLREIAFAGFGQDPPSTKTACLGIVLGDLSPGELTQYRALGAPLLLTLSPTWFKQWKVTAQGDPQLIAEASLNELVRIAPAQAMQWVVLTSRNGPLRCSGMAHLSGPVM